jgi:hypothetical protein
MPIVAIDGVGRVEIGDEFLSLSPEQQHATIQDIASSARKQDNGVSTLRAFGEGALSGITANFNDEIYGASKASGLPDILGGFRAPVGAARLAYESLTDQPGEASQAYDQAVAEKRALKQRAQEQHPGAYVAGNVAGAMVLPGGAMMQGATLPARIARGAAVGAAYGGLSGAGEGENLTDRASRAAVGTVLGGAVGAAAPPLVEGAIQGGRALARPVVNAVRGAMNPADEAARRVVTGLERDARVDPGAINRLSPGEFATEAQSGGPATIMDMGGETTRALARSAANTSPEGRQLLNETINNRYEGQTGRITNWFNDAFNFPNATAQQEAIDQTQKAVNRGAYARAYRDGDKPLWSPELERLTSAPAVEDALRSAAKTGQDRAVNQGYGGFNSPITISPDGRVVFNRGPSGVPTYPNLQFWDYARRELSDSASAAMRSGRKEEAARLGDLSRSLNNELDNLVPSYQQARAGAAQFFGASDALEAGKNYVASNFATPEARRALAQMSPTERQLFQDGFVSRYIETLDKAGDRRNILNQVAASPAAREKIEVALGPQRAAELEARLRVEGIMDLARGAVQGNSTTARQLAELGFAGGAGSLGAHGAYTTDPREMSAAAIAGALLAGKRHVDTRVAQQVARMLTGNDPQMVRRGIQLLSRSGGFMDALRTADSKIAQSGGQQVPTGLIPAMSAPGIGRAQDQPEIPRPPGQ